jgi:hypothetical protein
MNMIVPGLLLAGVFSIALGILHIPGIWEIAFPQWHAEIGSLSLLHRKLVNTVLVALCLAAVAFGLTTLLLAGSYPQFDSFQVWFLFFCFLFWLWRLLWQIFYFRYGEMKQWQHITVIVMFAVNTIAYVAPVFAAFTR